MDTGKLLKIIADIQEEEQGAKIQTLLTNIVSYYAQPDPVSLNTEKEKIRVAVTSSRLSQYALSDYQALEQLKVADLFGPGLFQRLENALSSQAHEVTTLLQQLVSDRSTAITSLDALQKNLTDFHFKSRALGDHNYEIGFILPTEYAEMKKTEEAIKDFRLFLEALSSAVGGQQPLKIKYVSNGSIEVFIQAGVILAHNFGVVIDYSLKIYGAIKAFADLKKQHAKYSEKRKKDANKIADDERKDQVRMLIDELITTLNLPTEDDKNRVRELFKKVLAHIEAGVGAEVHTPKIEAPVEPAADATKDERAQYKEALEQYTKKTEIDENNREIFILQQNNFYGMNTKFLNAPEDVTEEIAP